MPPADTPKISRLILTSLALLLAAVIGAVSFGSGRQLGRKEARFLEPAAATATAESSQPHAEVKPSDPGDVTSQQDFDAATAGWQTYGNPGLGFSFKYPRNWKLSLEQDDPSLPHAGRTDSDQAYIELMPAHEWAGWVSRPDPSDKLSAVGPVSIECRRSAGTLEVDADLYAGQDGYAAGYVDLRSGQRTYYVLGRAAPVQTFFAASGSVECSLNKATTDASPYSKEEDSEGMGIVNSFLFDSQR